jgi:hypothetical protein
VPSPHPAWDFHWQDVYYLTHPVTVGLADTIPRQVLPAPSHCTSGRFKMVDVEEQQDNRPEG